MKSRKALLSAVIILSTAASSAATVTHRFHDSDGVPVLISEDVAKRPVSEQGRSKYLPYVTAAAAEVLVDPELLSAVITRESGWQARARSPKGAIGLMQLMPQTARNWGVRNPWDPWQNIRAGSRYLKFLIELFDHNIPMALAAYHAGEERVMKDGAIPQIPETRSYVKAVQDTYADNLRKLTPALKK